MATALLVVGLLVPSAVGTPARAQSSDDLAQAAPASGLSGLPPGRSVATSSTELRAEQQEAEEALQDARESQAGIASELEDAVQDREAVETDLAEATAAVDAILTDIDAVEAEQAALRGEVDRLEGVVAEVRASLGAQIRSLYIQGAADDVVLAFDSDVVAEIGTRSHYLTALSRADRGRIEQLDVVTRQLAGRQEELVAVDERLAGLREEAESRQAELDRQLFIAAGVEEGVAAELAQAEAEARELAAAAEEAERRAEAAEEAERQAALAAAEEARRQAEAAAAAAAAATADAREQVAADGGGSSGGGSSGGGSSGGGGGGASAPVASSGMACPQDNPRSFTDTWGAPRSGGRSHQGTDIFGARGGNVFAITSGTVTRTTSGGISGLFLTLRGDDGHDYWYIHLQDFVARQGQRVSAGELIAHNGDTGNARGTTPHIHFEYHPGGGGPVNPYPLLASIC
ncbi:murein hydrolase activator EnvC [Euzebya sp.]|uniref:murein hydrolase activator EnvC family protein n=1 Tax=Euzebya sp. TaxID=1971409 RepID=UPI0035190AFD